MQNRTKALSSHAKAVFSALFAVVSIIQSASAEEHPPAIFEPGPLGLPRSLRQAGLPINETRAAIPPDNPQTPEKIALGEKLFFDRRLSADGTVACATCHQPSRAFTDGLTVSIGIHGRVGQRNAPTILNALYNRTQFWDGRATTLEEQAGFPIVNSVEMGQPSLDAAVNQLRTDKDYQQAFKQVFGRPPNSLDLRRAMASYERTLFSFNSPFDRFIEGEKNAISDSARHGWTLFNGQARCNKCHALTDKQPNLVNFTDNGFHNTGVGTVRHEVVPMAREAERMVNANNMLNVDRAAIQSDFSMLGRFLITKNRADIAAFKTPDLRNVMVTAPYFHDGSLLTLWDVLDHYNKGDGASDPFLDPDIQPLALTENDINDLVAFLASLTSDDYKELGARELARQRALALKFRPQRNTARAFGSKSAQPAPAVP